MHLMRNERKTRVIIALSEIKKYEENSLYMKNQCCSILEFIHDLQLLSQAPCNQTFLLVGGLLKFTPKVDVLSLFLQTKPR